jgi:ABC-type bacteriocin/lantibiotic exporter with double-glycine peptidase domain
VSHQRAAFPNNQSWTIKLANVRFGYPRNRCLLSIPQLEIRAGERVAIVGENGAGKSTLAKLLARLYDVDSGSISIAGCDVREVEIQSFREHVCYAPPHPVLFDTTIAGYLRVGKMTSAAAELEEAVKDVGLTAWVGTLQGGLNHRIGAGGYRVSGGQRQRIGVARAILQRPHVLILDEATSSLDAVSEQNLLLNLRKTLPESTIIVISHRVSSLLCVERVIFLEAGRAVEDEVPTALLGSSGACSRLFSAGASRLHPDI